MADTAIIEISATARTKPAIVPNSGITSVPIISIVVAPWVNGISNFRCAAVGHSSKSDSSPSTRTTKLVSGPHSRQDAGSSKSLIHCVS